MPFLASVSARQGGIVLANASKLPTPTFTGATPTNTGWYFTIGNYDALNTYTISTTAGSVSRVGSTVTQSGVGYSTTTTISITASRNGFLTSNTGSQAGTSNAAPPPPACTCCYGATVTEYRCISVPQGLIQQVRTGTAYDGTCGAAGGSGPSCSGACTGCSCPAFTEWGGWSNTGAFC